MDWGNIGSIIVALTVAIGVPLALKKRKKAGPLKLEELYQHLQTIGVEASPPEKESNKAKIGLSRASGQKSGGIIELKDKNIDCINIVSVASQYGVNYFLDYLVQSPNIVGNRTLKKTKLVKKKSSPIGGKVIGIGWKGEQSLAQSLSLDYRLEEKLLSGDLNALKEGIKIFPEPKHGYVRIRTSYILPSRQLFDAVSIVARHIKLY
ncbi:MAG: hypothetical protein U9Q17_01725 [Chloroflexota bacterium]|nr:hypothetical protein [Chloroflexota bacterium]